MRTKGVSLCIMIGETKELSCVKDVLKIKQGKFLLGTVANK